MSDEEVEMHMLEITLRVQGLRADRYERLQELRQRLAPPPSDDATVLDA